MTELATAPHKSALVFDDPVSSLDRKWRHKVADRLVDEAKRRQVIVFTHDLIFLNDITEGAEKAGVPCGVRHIRRSSGAVGVIDADLPWDDMKIMERIDSLEKQARAFIKNGADKEDDNFKRESRHFYDDLRAAWERALEEVAFADVVMRHRDYIKGRDLIRVSALTETDCAAWAQNFERCCDYVAAHDASRGRNRAAPEPTELLADVQKLDSWVRDLKQRQAAAQNRQ